MRRLFTNVGILQIFSALLLVIAIMFLSNYYVNRNSISSIYEKVSQNNVLAVQSTMQSFDNSFQTIENIIHSIHALPYNNVTDEDGRIDMARVYTMQDQITGLISSIDFIEEAIVFFDGVDLAVTSKGTGNIEYLFNEKYRHPMYNAAYWKTYVKSKHMAKVFPSSTYQVVTSETGKKTNLNLMVAVDSNNLRLSNKNVILLINELEFYKNVNMKSMIPGASLIILDQDRNLFLSTDPNLDLVEVLNDVYFNAGQEGSVTTKNYEYHVYKSDFNGYLYIDKVPYQFQNIDSVAKANQNIMMITIFCAIILSIFLSLYLNRPVKKIIRQLGGGSRRGNDFVKIWSGIVKLQTENEEYRQLQKFADAQVRRGLFLQAIDPYTDVAELDDPMHQYYPDFYRRKHFVLVLMHVTTQGDDQQVQALSTEALCDRLQSHLRQELPSLHVFYDKEMHFIAVAGIDKAAERESLIKRLNVVLPQLERGELAGYSIKANVSKLYASEIDKCKHAYHDVSKGLMHRGVNDSSAALDMDNLSYEGKLYFPLEKVAKLQNHVIKGNWNGCREIISELVRRNAELGVRRLPFSQMAKSLFYQMIRHAGALNRDKQELLELESAFMRKVDAVHDYQAIEKMLLEVVDHLSKQVRLEPVSKLNPTFIAQYIELHYMDNLYLDQIAEVTETSPKYFSNYFKKTFGVNYVEYLNKVRLTHAREMLKETSLSVAEIGERTGYLNASTFTTTFKKYYGISPSEYRKQEVS